MYTPESLNDEWLWIFHETKLTVNQDMRWLRIAIGMLLLIAVLSNLSGACRKKSVRAEPSM